MNNIHNLEKEFEVVAKKLGIRNDFDNNVNTTIPLKFDIMENFKKYKYYILVIFVLLFIALWYKKPWFVITDEKLNTLSLVMYTFTGTVIVILSYIFIPKLINSIKKGGMKNIK